MARLLWSLALVTLAGWCHPVQAQWITQTNTLKPGWNSVYLHVDASHTNLNSLIDPLGPIEEIWLWTFDLPPGLSLGTPPAPTPGSRWSKWTKVEGPNSVLQTLPGNSAMLVRVSSNFVAAYDWKIKGRPVAPNHRWALSGLNFVGFPSAGANFDTFLGADAQAVDWKGPGTEIFRYQGGDLGSTNPILVSSLLQRHPILGKVNREQAYWIRAGDLTNQFYNHYFGPFEVTGADAGGVRFGDSQGQARLRLKNLTRTNLTVTLRELASEVSPGGVTPPLLLPLMVRGPINNTNLTFGYSNLANGPLQWTLAPAGSPGSEVEIVLGVDRTQMGTLAGTEFAGVLRFTDSLGLMRTEIGASATTPSSIGLWVGNAAVTNVSQYLKPYAKATNVATFHQKLISLTLTVGSSTQSVAFGLDGRRYEWDTNTGRILVFGSATNQPNSPTNHGSYLVDGEIRLIPDNVARPFPLRLIIHNDGSSAKLLQRAYVGHDCTSNLVVARKQSSLLSADLANARRLSAVHLPTSDANEGWAFNNAMRAGAAMATTVDLRFNDQSSNPFLHTYHPDHDNRDNRDDTFQTEFSVGGKESYDIRRVIILTFDGQELDFDSRSRGGTSLAGRYAETVSFRAGNSVLKEFNVLGAFTLTRITDAAMTTCNQ